MSYTAKPELEELEKRLKERWPKLSFFNIFGTLNEYGEIAEGYLELEAKLKASTSA